MNGRHDIAVELMGYYNMTAYGCLGSGDRVDKIQVFSRSKFCKLGIYLSLQIAIIIQIGSAYTPTGIAMENSNSVDYVSLAKT
jgi:hypothetical protein